MKYLNDLIQLIKKIIRIKRTTPISNIKITSTGREYIDLSGKTSKEMAQEIIDSLNWKSIR